MHSVSRLRRQMDHEARLAQFRSRQACLATGSALYFAVAIVGFAWLFVPLAVLMIQTATDEARRFRRTGTWLQTRRSIREGITPHDAAHRQLLGLGVEAAETTDRQRETGMLTGATRYRVNWRGKVIVEVEYWWYGMLPNSRKVGWFRDWRDASWKDLRRLKRPEILDVSPRPEVQGEEREPQL